MNARNAQSLAENEMKDHQLLKEPTAEMLVLDEPIDGWLFVVPADMVEVKQPTRMQKLRNIGTNALKDMVKVVRGH